MLVQLLVNNLHAIMFKGCIGAHYYLHECRFFFQLHPSVLFKAISLIYGLQSFRLALRPQNHTKAEQFSPHSRPSHSDQSR